jgi:hypothetical protein
MLTRANLQQRFFVKLDHREVIEKRNVVWLTFLTLKLLTSQHVAVRAGELINGVSNHYAEMLHSHFVNTSVHWGYQLNHLRRKSSAQN